MSFLMTKAPIERFLEKVVINPSGCWIWQGALIRGYGTFRIGSRKDGTYKNIKAHRFSYEYFLGSIPADKEPDHLCRNRACVNSDHLEVVTHQINMLRGRNPAAENATKTHCPQGHPYDIINTCFSKGLRYCRTCLNERRRIRRQKEALNVV